MRHKQVKCDFGCSVEVAIEAIGGKWKGVILHHLSDGSKRFNELRRLIPDVTQRMLTKQLRNLEKDGIVERHVYTVVPPKVEYSLTPFGKTLLPILVELRKWGDTYIKKFAKVRQAQE